QGNAWHYTLDVLDRYFEMVLTQPSSVEPTVPSKSVFTLLEDPVPPLAGELIGSYLASAQLLGQRTAELHLALAADGQDPHFAPELFSTHYQRSIYQT